jgi:transcription initiation factor TFIIIB Brf1 subunit/transcription initiation factor TFIIB
MGIEDKLEKKVDLSTKFELRSSEGYSKIDDLCSTLNLPESLGFEAKGYFVQGYKRLVKERGTERGGWGPFYIDKLAAASVLLACRVNDKKYFRGLYEVAETAGFKPKEFRRSYYKIVKTAGVRVPPVEAKDYIPRMIKRLGVDTKVCEKALDLLSSFDGSISYQPLSLAAVAVYIAAKRCKNNEISKSIIAEVSGVSESTITSACTDLRKAKLIK